MKLDSTNYATKKKLEDATNVDTSDVTNKKCFIALKVKSWKTTIFNCCIAICSRINGKIPIW